MRYAITVGGAPGPVLFAVLEGFELSPGPQGQTRVVGFVHDQSELQGVLHRLHDLHVDLLEVRRLEDEPDP
jgi:hypothetical protein